MHFTATMLRPLDGRSAMEESINVKSTEPGADKSSTCCVSLACGRTRSIHTEKSERTPRRFRLSRFFIR
jgi:hypothetical protein